MRVGLVCPYSLEVPGGVQAHVMDLAHTLIGLGHRVNVLAAADEDTDLPSFVTPAGRAMGIPYNGSVARLSFGPVSFARARRWVRDHRFDVLHLHEPVAPSLSLLTLMVADGPIVATFHTSTQRSRTLAAFHSVLQPFMEKITARIAVSALARRVQVEHLGGDAVLIPNGVDVDFFASADPLVGYPRRGGTVGFVGRYGESRKGMSVLLGAMRLLISRRPDLRLVVVGRGDAEALRTEAGPELADRLDLLGQVSDIDKARALRSVDVYCAPNTGGESFGIILAEAMAAGTAVVASDLDAFRRVLDDGRAGVLSPVGDPAALAQRLADLLDDPARRDDYAESGRRFVENFDWPVVARQVLRVYETAMAADPRRVGEADDAPDDEEPVDGRSWGDPE
ncbi:glycosyltransferase family 4 protein [Actinoalloteichus hymeniacidonis]|uniref:Glycosyltransferase n=1 Tax=Actinoalloteichus hymeniacidonis TaxID=340345 RepID=A0AAC9HQX9_9PSEU|nr:glycosyltransferase family 4 protein [Actinoalloteichus hymeniacidonis]AOS62885.1 glycosyltransferase [Actinoalloteichus hymeniacidonis]MBB5909082.1 phosphatidylinositol alpha-mannosyltransferase [Actinoalloteichus hymeniacidonis]